MTSSADPDRTTEAIYTAIGFAILGAQRLQYERRQLEKGLKSRFAELPATTRDDISAIVEAVEVGLEQARITTPPPVSDAVALLLSTTRHMREQVLDTRPDHSAAARGSTATSTTPGPATEDT